MAEDLSHPGSVARRVGGAWTEVDATRRLVHHAARIAGAGDPRATQALLAAKAKAAKTGIHITDTAMALVGGCDPAAERLRTQISFVPGLASAWIVATSASPRSLAAVLHKAVSASVRRRQLHVLRREINQQLSPRSNQSEDLPVSGEGVLANRPQAAIAKASRGGMSTPRARSRTVLLCEDEDMVRDALGELLEAKGYKALLASDGAEAMQLAARNDFDVLVADIGLADMSGVELARRVRETRPDCAVLFASGRRENLPTELADAKFILKPFGIEELCEAIASTSPPR